MTVRNIGNLVEDAVRLQTKLDYIQFYTHEDEATANLVQLRTLLAVEATTYNVDELERFVLSNSERINAKYREVGENDFSDEGEDTPEPRDYDELLIYASDFNAIWNTEYNQYVGDKVAKRQDWLNYLDALCKNDEITEEEEEIIAVAIQ